MQSVTVSVTGEPVRASAAGVPALDAAGLGACAAKSAVVRDVNRAEIRAESKVQRFVRFGDKQRCSGGVTRQTGACVKADSARAHIRKHQVAGRDLRHARAGEAARHRRDAAPVRGLKIDVAVFDGIGRAGLTAGVIVGRVAIDIHRRVNLVVARAVQPAICPNQPVIDSVLDGRNPGELWIDPTDPSRNSMLLSRYGFTFGWGNLLADS